MGIGEILGVRTIKISTSSPYSLEEFFEKIKDTPFDAGKPALVKDGLTGLSGAFGSAKKKCMELAQNTADIILAMNL